MDLISRDKAQEIIPKVVLGMSDFAECIRDSVDSVFDNCPSAFEGMTNGEVIQAVFGVMVLTVKDGKVWVERIFFPFDEVWWNAPYKAESEDKE